MRVVLILFLLITIYNKDVEAKRQNVLFIIVDDLRPALQCYGDKSSRTPNINSLAERSFLFKNAFAQQALCAPSRNSLLMSRRPDSLRLYDFDSYWRTTVGNFTTLPQYFKENGYYTYSIGKVFHPGVSSNFTDDYPYSWSKKTFHPSTERYTNEATCVGKNGRLSRNLICPVIVELQPESTLPDMQSLEEAVNFLKYKNNITDKPFFLAVGFHKPHVPFKVPSNYFDLYPIENISLPTNTFRPSLMPEVAWNPWTDIRSRDDMKLLNLSFPFGPMPDKITKEIIQAYYAATTYVDDLTGDLLKQIDNDTIVVFTSDHGWSLGQHGEFAKYSNFDEATRVPLLIHIPGLTNKKIVIKNHVELVDLFPTLVDLTQVGEPLKLCPVNNTEDVCTEGRSLVPVMVNATLGKNILQKSVVFTQYPRPGPFPTNVPNSDKPKLRDIKIMGYSIRTDRYRYTEWVKFNITTFKADWNKLYAKELYDHLIDPEENMNLSDRKELDWIMRMLENKLKLGWRYI